MNNPYILLLDTGVAVLQAFLGGLKNKAPSYVLSALQAAVDALAAHSADEVTKANLEAQRG